MQDLVTNFLRPEVIAAVDWDVPNCRGEYRRHPSSEARVPPTAPSLSYCSCRSDALAFTLPVRNTPAQRDSPWERRLRSASEELARFITDSVLAAPGLYCDQLHINHPNDICLVCRGLATVQYLISPS